ncbi:GNAT family N-acetyltransferase [Piscibacillus halophilus]|uniref:Protein N-acetyltransferase, RimJ/RimL family n=1 Tax=Piscibacillus halophilus TaxID=571933 RepID=A0A1H9GFK5_9BACI|nr:GNAT family N-acetyltransferase [Piscibacillus halophilus]SEQ48871.1 Protein N-acetyltransferase, RimJ/RimL family [Piscibacillus halophilus]
MLKKRDLHDAPILFPLLNDLAVKPYVREKAETIEEYYFFLNKMMIQEENGELISRTIVDEWDAPIGAITLYDTQDQMGFLATWIGKPYFGKGYNQYAKDLFLRELFLEKDIEIVFLKVNKVNERSLNAMKKIEYAVHASEHYPAIHEQINRGSKKYELFAIYKDAFIFHLHEQEQDTYGELEA